jgi:serpin B
MFMWGFGAGRYGAVDPDGKWFETPTTYNPEVPKEDQNLYPAYGGFTIAELPYKGSQLSMVLLAPRARDTLPQVEKLLTAERLTDWMEKMESRPISRLSVPKLDFDTAYDLTQQLSDLGMPLPFTEPSTSGGADFSRMVAPDSLARKAYLSMIVQKAILKVDELGTVAAAVTAGFDVAEGMADWDEGSAPFSPDFLADRPFLMLIRDTQSGDILFMGRINDPR